jgi:hypothetical protein
VKKEQDYQGQALTAVSAPNRPKAHSTTRAIVVYWLNVFVIAAEPTTDSVGIASLPAHIAIQVQPLDADSSSSSSFVFFSYLVPDDLSIHSERILDRADKGLLKLHAASEIYDDLVTALRSNNTPMKVVIEFLGDLRMIRHEVLPTTLDVAA